MAEHRSPAAAVRRTDGQESWGQARILVGPGAYVFDALARMAPTHYHGVTAVLEKRHRPRQEGSR